MATRLVRWALALALSLAALPCSAQETGSSFGGGDWGGSDPGSSGSSGYGGSTSSHRGSGSAHDYGVQRRRRRSRSSGDFGEVSVGVVVVIGAVFVLVMVALQRMAASDRQLFRDGDQSFYAGPPQRARAWGQVDVSAIRIAVDWRARRYLQARLDALARSGRTRTKAGLVELLRSTAELLSSVRLAWLYGGATNHRPMEKLEAQGTFTKLGVDARSRFRRELVRVEDGVTTEGDAAALTPRAEEGAGVVVVTILVAARRELFDVGPASDANELESALAGLRRLSENDLVALEVVWSPSAEDDRMSTAELEALYPDLVRLDEASVGGRVFCDYCAGPFAEELGRCPHCGAPNEAEAT